MARDITKVRNFGISAHIDSGKTTTSERILFYTGKIHKINEVRGKTGDGATMDSMDLEREKGITIQSAATFGRWRDMEFNLIDTPGHVDFTVEVERALRVLDGAVLLLCGVGGVQSQSLTVDRQMKRYNIPRVVFVNKLDRAGANPFRARDQVVEKLGLNAWLLQIPIGLEADHKGIVDLVTMESVIFEGDNGEKIVRGSIPADLKDLAEEKRHALIEALADVNDIIAEKFLEGIEPTLEEVKTAIRESTIARTFVPVLMGSAYKNKGVQLLLDAVCDYLPSPVDVVNKGFDQETHTEDGKEKEITLESDSEKPLIMYAFKLDETRFGQLTYMRVYQGKVSRGDTIHNINDGKRMKVPRLVRMHADEMMDSDHAEAGDIFATFGVDCASGDTFTDGTVRVTCASIFVPDAVVSLAITPRNKTSTTNFSKALGKFVKEDPTFRSHRDEESGQTIIEGMGELHLEIYVERMKREFACEVDVGKPQVNYRETITTRIDFQQTHKKQSGGSGQFARICGYMEPIPLEDNKNYEFLNEVVGGSISKGFIPAIDKGIQEQMKTGMLIGAPLVNFRYCVNDGLEHPVDSSEMAFKLCAMASLREHYEACKPVILEPIMSVGLEGPEEFQGAMMGLTNQRRGVIMGSSNEGNFCQIQAEVPLSEMFGFTTSLRSATQGKGESQMTFCRYAQAPRMVQDQLVEEYKKKRAAENK